MNLIKNSEDALLDNKIDNPTITVRCHCNAGKSILEVEDNAGGIDELLLEQIFEPYFTTKEEYNGTGLGLYMSKIIVEEHCGGVLSVCNTAEGVIFKITLPHLDDMLQQPESVN